MLQLSKTEPLVSIIVPTKNSEGTIEKCLRSIEGQYYGNIEIIVVDNFSRDNTRSIAKELGAVLYLKGPERSAQVNFGIKKASGEYAYRVDSDVVLHPNVVREAVETCEKQGFDAIAVHNSSDSTVSFWARVRKLERDCYRYSELNVASRFWKKRVFETVGGFDENLVGGEDYDLQNRLVKSGFRIGRIQAEEVHIGEPKTLVEVVQKHYSYGKSIWRFVKKNPQEALRQLSPLRASHLKGLPGFSSDPMLMMGFVIYQFVRYAATMIGIVTKGITVFQGLSGTGCDEFMNVTLKLVGEAQRQERSEQPPVSVIIPTKNSETTLPTGLSSIRNQTYPNIEIIVVDSFSRDRTKEIAEYYGARVIEANAKRSEARNRGAILARGEFVFFVDSDMELDFDVIEECVGKTREGSDAIIVPEISVGVGFWAECKALEKLCYIGDDLIEGTRFFRKNVFEALGGYDPQLEAGEDWDLCNRTRETGYRIARINRFIRHHEGRLSLKDSVRKKQYYAKTIDRYIQKHPALAKKQLTFLRLAFIRNWRRIVADPIHGAGLLGMKTCEFVVVQLGLVKSKAAEEEQVSSVRARDCRHEPIGNLKDMISSQ
jgi:glycosyltransferase involved in cell wall biosynthesis